MDELFRLAWTRFRTWDGTSQALKADNERWKRRVLVLTLAGTALGALAPFSGGLLGGGPWPARLFGIVGTLCLALATYFAKELLDTQHQDRWTRARTAAEVYKSEAFKYAMLAPPYDTGDRGSAFSARMAAVESLTKGLVPLPLIAKDEEVPGQTWSTDEYLRQRLVDQIEWYRRRAADHVRTLRKGRAITLVLGGLAVLLSAITGATAQDGTYWAALLGVVTTAGGAIGAHVQAGQYQALAVKYSETADALERCRVRFATSPREVHPQLVADAEAIMQTENAGWLVERTATAG
jgi:hypothetical protein